MSFDVQKEKGVFFDVGDEFVERNQALTFVIVLVLEDGPILEMP